MPAFSVVIPAMNEAGNIGRLVVEIHETLTDDPPAEIIVIDDGSDDATADELRAAMAQVPALRVLRHDRRSGQSAAVRSGVRAARAEVIVTMDGDGQNPPADIPKLLAALADGPAGEPALVNGWRTGRKASGSRRLASRFANRVRQWALKDDCPDSGCGLKAFWRENYLALPFFATMHRFMPALFGLYGRQTATVEVGDRARDAGASKYTNWKRGLDGAFDLLAFTWLRSRTRTPVATEIER
ncbi:glycosyltransferase family 2 protein [Minwuia thermotolerans]|uniref:Glycosyl transferase n=1 Tax=Minwuia thermotolerans TaxID=2056226 RepID=A0A2M9FZN3_9PROT|nr:glycosyltransferase family 2 protein [Minwuia thermotolerans]PJK28941.1 glycosyl transferase [Minwuia thermotolerans]